MCALSKINKDKRKMLIAGKVFASISMHSDLLLCSTNESNALLTINQMRKRMEKIDNSIEICGNGDFFMK